MLLKPLGAPKGKVRTFIEVPFKLGGRSIRPDGIIAVTRGATAWGAIVETKVGASGLETDRRRLFKRSIEECPTLTRRTSSTS